MQTETSIGQRTDARRNTKLTVLIVEDETILRLVVVERLQEHGFYVLEAADASEAIDLLESGAPIDAVFSDIQMPGDLTGLDLARWVLEHRPQTAVILTSAKATNVRDRGARDDFAILVKPYDASEVAARIRALVQAKRSAPKERRADRGAQASDPAEAARQADRMRDSYLGLARTMRAHNGRRPVGRD